MYLTVSRYLKGTTLNFFLNIILVMRASMIECVCLLSQGAYLSMCEGSATMLFRSGLFLFVYFLVVVWIQIVVV